MASRPHGAAPHSQASILSRLIRPEDDRLPPEAAEALLGIRFEQLDLDRMHELAETNQGEGLSSREREEMENYRQVAYILDLLHSMARRALKKQRTVH